MADPKDLDDDIVDDADADPADDAADDDADAEPMDEAADDDADDADADAGEPSSASRRETRTQRLANEARTEREKRIRLEGELTSLRNGGTKPAVDPEKAARERAEKLAIMDPVERKAFENEEAITQMRQESRITQMQTQNMLDKMAFDQKATTNPVYAKHADAIETYINTELSAGRVPPKREIILRLKLGDELLKPSPKTKKQVAADKAAAEVRKAKANGTAQSARGDTGVKSGKNDPDSLEAITARIHAAERAAGTRE